MIDIVRLAHEHGCNPGGEVHVFRIADDQESAVMRAQSRFLVLLDREGCAELDMIVRAVPE